MIGQGLRIATCVTMLLIATPFTVGATSRASDFDSEILAAHNRERATLGLPPLRWQPQLAEAARAWADHLATTGSFAHAPQSETAQEGENLWAGPAGRFAANAMVQGWIAEKRYFKPGTFPDNSITGNWTDVGHYTQVVWRDTRAVGCALSSTGGRDVLVCRYAEPGNYMGERPF